VKPGWDAASGPAAIACEANSMVRAPPPTRTYSDQLETMAPRPSPTRELNSLMTAASNPQQIPVAAPSSAARRDRVTRRGHTGARVRPSRDSTATVVTTAASHRSEPGACSRPPDGAATHKNAARPIDIAAAASQSRRWTPARDPIAVM
jgi:hypothetical protein